MYSTRALYIQVRDHLAHQIARGALKPGTLLPNELELADQLGVSLGTLRKGLEALEKERLITRRHGRGTFVRDHAVDTPFTFDNLRTKDDEPIPSRSSFLARRLNGPVPRSRNGSNSRNLNSLVDVNKFGITRGRSCSNKSRSPLHASAALKAQNCRSPTSSQCLPKNMEFWWVMRSRA